jgi:hypothetical protein
VPNAALTNSGVSTINSFSCSPGASCSVSGGTNTQTTSYTAVASDNGKLIVMNCASACTFTLPNPAPSASWYVRVITVGASNATVSLNSLQFNGATAVPLLNSYRDIDFYSDGTNYWGRAPFVAGTGITLTGATNGVTLAANVGGLIPFDSTASGLIAPTGNGSFTYPATNGLTLAGTAPASVSGAGTAAGTLLSATGSIGGATTGSATTAGTGGVVSITTGAGGSGSGGTNAIGGAGGALNITTGAGGASGGTAVNSNGGDVVVTLGAKGTGGSGTAGRYGLFRLLSGSGNSTGVLEIRNTANSVSAFLGASTTNGDLKLLSDATAGTFGGSLTLNNIAEIGKTTTYNSVATAGEGVPPIYGTIASPDTDRTASLADTTIYTTGSTGLYRFSVAIISNGTCSVAGPAGVTVGLKWTDVAGAKSQTSIPLDVNGSATLSGSVPLGDTTSYGSGTFPFKAAASSTIQVNTTLTACTTGTATYRLDAAVEQLR